MTEHHHVAFVSITALAAAVALSIALPSVTRAQDYEELPTVEQVVAEHVGWNHPDSAARQVAAFELLMGYIEDVSGASHPGDMPPAARAKYERYGAARSAAVRLASRSSVQVGEYKSSASFRRRVLSEYTSTSDQAIAFVSSAMEETGVTWWVAGGILVLLLLLARSIIGVAREFFLPFGISSSKPGVLRAGWARYPLSTSTGQVLHHEKSRSVQTHVTGSSSTGVSSYNTTTVHQDFWIKDKGGQEHRYEATNVNFGLRDGHIISAINAKQKKKKRTRVLAFVNHNTGGVDFMEPTMRELLRVRLWFLWLAFVVGLSGAFQGDESVKTMLFFAAGTIVAVGWVYWFVASRLRVRRTKKQLEKFYFPTLEEAAQALSQPRLVGPDTIEGPGGILVGRGS